MPIRYTRDVEKAAEYVYMRGENPSWSGFKNEWRKIRDRKCG